MGDYRNEAWAAYYACPTTANFDEVCAAEQTATGASANSEGQSEASFKVGDKVIRKAALGKSAAYRETGIVQWIGQAHARVEWLGCSARIGGDGNFHTTVLVTTLLPLTPENEAKRQARITEDRAARKAQEERTRAGHQARWDGLQPGQKWLLGCPCYGLGKGAYHTYLGADADGQRQFQCPFCGQVSTRATQPMVWR